jgi:hypothetical protein
MRIDNLVLLAIPSAMVLASCSASRAQDAASDGPDLTESMILESAAGCRFDPLTEHALDGMLLLTDWDPFTMRSAPKVFVGDFALTPEVESKTEPGEWGATIYTSRAPFPEGTRWNGLHPTALHGYYVNNPGSDHFEERGIVFADTPQELHDRLKAIEQEVPLPGENLPLTERGPYWGPGCFSAIEIRPEGEGSILGCGYGC